MGNKTKFGDTHLSAPYQNGQFCNFIDDAIVSRPGCSPLLPKCFKTSNPYCYISIESYLFNFKFIFAVIA